MSPHLNNMYTNDTSVEEPSVDEPSVDEPSLDEPSLDEPSLDEPSLDELLLTFDVPEGPLEELTWPCDEEELDAVMLDCSHVFDEDISELLIGMRPDDARELAAEGGAPTQQPDQRRRRHIDRWTPKTGESNRNAELLAAIWADTPVVEGPNLQNTAVYIARRAAEVAGQGLTACDILEAKLRYTDRKNKSMAYTAKDLSYDLKNGYLAAQDTAAV